MKDRIDRIKGHITRKSESFKQHLERVGDKSQEILHRWEDKSREFITDFLDLFGRDTRLVRAYLLLRYLNSHALPQQTVTKGGQQKHVPMLLHFPLEFTLRLDSTRTLIKMFSYNFDVVFHKLSFLSSITMRCCIGESAPLQYVRYIILPRSQRYEKLFCLSSRVQVLPFDGTTPRDSYAGNCRESATLLTLK